MKARRSCDDIPCASGALRGNSAAGTTIATRSVGKSRRRERTRDMIGRTSG
jgi:hypothetical protein